MFSLFLIKIFLRLFGHKIFQTQFLVGKIKKQTCKEDNIWFGYTASS